jgi:hypothetical protein
MQVYTIHLRGMTGSPGQDTQVIKEGFCWPAFLFGPLWALWHRMWFTFLGLSAGYALMALGATIVNLDEIVIDAIFIGVAAVIGFCGNDWRRAGLAARGWQMKGLSAATDRDAALRRFIDLHPADPTPPPAGHAPGY